MGTRVTMSSMDKDTSRIVVNGVYYTLAQYKKMLKEQKPKVTAKKKVKKTDKGINLLADEIEKLIKSMTTLKSIQVYKTHAYRSWGTIANEILAYRGINKPMSHYVVRYGEMNSILADIKMLSKKNDKAIFQYIDKLSWKLEDMMEDIQAIMTAVRESEVCKRHKDHEAIYGKGRQLGLKTIVEKAYKTMKTMEETIEELRKLADEGVDPFECGEHMSLRTRARCWA